MNDIQRRANEFCKKYNLKHDATIRMHDLNSEVGELSKEILKMSDYGKHKIKIRPETEAEMGDVVFALATLANELNLDLDRALDLVLEKYKKRIELSGNPGSNK